MNNDQKIDKLRQRISEKKAQIEKSTRPTWNTNCSFPSNSGPKNLHTLVDRDLVNILAELIGRKRNFDDACQLLKVNFTFELGGYSFEAWSEDIQTRLLVSQISQQKTQLKEFERVLSELESPDMKTQRQLASIEEFLQ